MLIFTENDIKMSLDMMILQFIGSHVKKFTKNFACTGYLSGQYFQPFLFYEGRFPGRPIHRLFSQQCFLITSSTIINDFLK